MKNYRKTHKNLSLIQKIIICIIILLFILVIIYIIFTSLHTSENLVKSKISTLASNYYENYLYDYAKNSDTNSTPSEALKEYETIGLSVVYLRQLLYHDDQVDAETINYLSTHCDENETMVKYYPEPPFTKTSYRVEYTYSCDF